MKTKIIAVIGMFIICISGCAQSLPPHEELNQAFKKSFDASGFNYSSKTRITNLSIPKQESDNSKAMAIGAGIEAFKGISIDAVGAVDMKGKKAEVLYDLRYDKDNVNVSVKLPLFVDYNTQTIYLGTSFLNTVLETAYPLAPATKGKLIKININEILKENMEDSPELSKLLNKNYFSAKNVDLINNAIKSSILKTVAKRNDSYFTDQQLTEQDKSVGIKRRIRMTLGHKDSVAVVMDIIDGISQTLFQDGLITKKEYDVLHELTNKKEIEGLTDQCILAMTFDIGIAPSGLIDYLDSQLNITDKEGSYQMGINNLSSFSNYEAPAFSIKPDAVGFVDLKEILNTIKADKEKKQQGYKPETDCSEECEEAE